MNNVKTSPQPNIFFSLTSKQYFSHGLLAYSYQFLYPISYFYTNNND